MQEKRLCYKINENQWNKSIDKTVLKESSIIEIIKKENESLELITFEKQNHKFEQTQSKIIDKCSGLKFLNQFFVLLSNTINKNIQKDDDD